MVALAAVALAGCKATLQTGELEDATRDQFRTSIGVEVEEIDCPDDVAASSGATFTCTARAADGSSVTFGVTQTDDSGHVRFDDQFVRTPAVEESLTKEIGAGGKVECPDLVLLERGASFDCDTSDTSGERQVVEVTINDEAGSDVSYELKNAGEETIG